MNNLHNINENISRAIEISFAGNHPIAFVASKELIEAFGMGQLKKDIQTITFDFIGRVNRAYTFEDADIIVGYSDFDMDSYWRCKDNKKETIEDVFKRINEVDKDLKLQIENTARALLKTAKIRINLSLSMVEEVIRVANTIAKLDKASKIRAEHIAEAIQYRVVERDEYEII